MRHFRNCRRTRRWHLFLCNGAAGKKCGEKSGSGDEVHDDGWMILVVVIG
jgi:hypothetical protein